MTVPVPYVARCPRATGSLRNVTLGLVRLGMTRAQARHAFTRSSDRGKRFQDFFCLTPIGVRVGYASTSLQRTLSRGEARRVKGRVILALTSNPHYSIAGVRPDVTSFARARRLLGRGNVYHVGLNYWYENRVGSTNRGAEGSPRSRGGDRDLQFAAHEDPKGTAHDDQELLLRSTSRRRTWSGRRRRPPRPRKGALGQQS